MVTQGRIREDTGDKGGQQCCGSVAMVPVAGRDQGAQLIQGAVDCIPVWRRGKKMVSQVTRNTKQIHVAVVLIPKLSFRSGAHMGFSERVDTISN